MEKHDVKIYYSGNVVEVIKFGKPIVKNMKDRPPPCGRAKEASEDEKAINRLHAMRRSRSELRRIISANNGQWKDARGRPYKSVFMTLTFADNIQDFVTANYEFKLFIMRLGNKVGSRNNQNCLKYAVVPEFQKRGAIHYHLILFNLPYLPSKSITACWGNGFIKLNAIDKVDNVGAYISKYMSKNIEEERLRGKKSYFTSRGLLKPQKIEIDTTKDKQKEMLQTVSKTAKALAIKEPYEITFKSDYFEHITYTQYIINKIS